MVKNLPANARNTGDKGSIPGSRTSTEKEMATHSSILAWEVLRTEKPGGYSPQGCKESDRLQRQNTAQHCKTVSLNSNFGLELNTSLPSCRES